MPLFVYPRNTATGSVGTTGSVVAVPGPPGPAGPAGAPGKPGQPRFVGNGPPPDVILGAEPGDSYVDLTNGTTYHLR